MIIDDYLQILQMTEMSLRSAGYEVLTASDGKEGLQRAQDHSPDLIVLDIMLPGLDGYNLARMLKFDLRYKSIPIIALSGRNKDIDKELGAQVGVDAYITKPFDMDLLIDKIKEILNAH